LQLLRDLATETVAREINVGQHWQLSMRIGYVSGKTVASQRYRNQPFTVLNFWDRTGEGFMCEVDDTHYQRFKEILRQIAIETIKRC